MRTRNPNGKFEDSNAVPDLPALEAAVRDNPDDPDCWFQLGKLLLDSGQNRRAEAMLRQTVRRAPECAKYRFYLGTALGNLGKFPEAAGQFGHLAAVDPGLDDPMSMIGTSALSHLGSCLGEMGRWKEAAAAFAPAVPVAVSILDDFAGFLCDSGEYNHACFIYSVALLLAPKAAGLHHGAGHSHMKAGRLPEALKHLQRARKADPEDPDILYDLGLTLARLKRRDQARRWFRRVVVLDPKYAWAWYDLACLDALEGKASAAFRKLYKSIECGFGDSDYLRRDPDFNVIHKDPRWAVVLDCLSRRAVSKGIDPEPHQQVH